MIEYLGRKKYVPKGIDLMNQIKKKNEAKLTFFHFPDYINNLTFVLIIVLYGFILGLILTLAFPKMSYQVVPDYPFGKYDTEINPYLFVRAVPTEVENNDQEKEIDVLYDLYAYIRAMNNNNKPSKVKFGFSALDNDERMNFFTEPLQRSGYTPPLTHYSIGSKLSNKSGYDEFYLRTQYKIKVDGVDQTKFLKIAEKVLKLEKKELSSSQFTQSPNDLVNITFRVKDSNTTDNQYEGTVIIEAKDLTKNYHINMQSWLVTEDQKIYPFLGLYNFCSKVKFDTTNYPSTIYRYIKPAYIYMKLEYQSETGEISYIYYKESVSTLLNNQ